MNVTFVVGPTACGKSDLAMKMAQTAKNAGRASAIVNCDSIQVYQGLRIGSALPSESDLAKIPHFLYSYVPKGERITVGQYVRSFQATMQELEKQFAEVFVVGGTGFYFQAIEKGLFEIGSANDLIRNEIETQLATPDGPSRIHDELAAGDPVSASRISLNDHYRLARAVEILRVHGKSLTQIQAEFESARKPFPWPLKKVGCTGDREVRARRIAQRTDKMLAEGLVDEVRGLISEGLETWEPLKSVGYREVLQFLQEADEVKDAAALKAKICQSTLQLTKKQITWFKRDKEIQWQKQN